MMSQKNVRQKEVIRKNGCTFLDCRLPPFDLCFFTARGGFTDVSQTSLGVDTHIQSNDKIRDERRWEQEMRQDERGDVTKNTTSFKKKKLHMASWLF